MKTAERKYGWVKPKTNKKIKTDKPEKTSNLPENIDKLSNSFRITKKYVANDQLLDGFQSLLLLKK